MTWRLIDRVVYLFCFYCVMILQPKYLYDRYSFIVCMYMYIATGSIFIKTDGVLAMEGQLPAGSCPSVTLTILFLNINLYVMYMYDQEVLFF